MVEGHVDLLSLVQLRADALELPRLEHLLVLVQPVHWEDRHVRVLDLQSSVVGLLGCFPHIKNSFVVVLVGHVVVATVSNGVLEGTFKSIPHEIGLIDHNHLSRLWMQVVRFSDVGYPLVGPHGGIFLHDETVVRRLLLRVKLRMRSLHYFLLLHWFLCHTHFLLAIMLTLRGWLSLNILHLPAALLLLQ